jgi:hypothetical protein
MENMQMRTTIMRIIRLSLAALAAAAWLSPANATSVLPLFLDEVIDTAAVAFEGTCVDNRSERDPATGFVVTYTTFEVRDVLKGDVASRHTIKQVGGALAGDQVDRRIDGIPRFAIGQDYVVFLAGVSSIGFSSPIGLSQGRFQVRAQGATRVVANGRDFAEITARMRAHLPAAAAARFQKAGGANREMDLQDFKQAVRNHVGAPR